MSSPGIYYLNSEIPVWTEDPLSDTVNLKQVLEKVESLIPSAFLKYVQAVRIGMFDEMIERSVNALYKDGVLYITNIQDNNQDIINSDIIYDDGEIQQEFIGKRKRLYNLLKSEGFDVIIEQFLKPEYDEDFDMFLFQDIGYPVLSTIADGLFLSPYSITSINEYFAIGFESFYIDKSPYLKRMCPQLSNKIEYLDEMTDEY